MFCSVNSVRSVVKMLLIMGIGMPRPRSGIKKAPDNGGPNVVTAHTVCSPERVDDVHTLITTTPSEPAVLHLQENTVRVQQPLYVHFNTGQFPLEEIARGLQFAAGKILVS